MAKAKKQTPNSPKKILVMAHNHPAFFPGGGEIMAYDIFCEMRQTEGYNAMFLAATGAISRKAHNGTAFLGMEGTHDEYLFYNDAFNYLNQSNLQLDILNHEFADFLREIQPDIIHMHHILRFGVEAIAVMRRVLPKVKIALTLHDFIPICHRDGQMIRKNGNELCEYATPSRCNGCFPEITPPAFKLREYFIKTHFEMVDAFISPSKFLAHRYVKWGLPAEKIHVIENGTKPTTPAPARKLAFRGVRNQFAFFGQISPYKGIPILLDAVRILAKRGINDFHVNIHGNISMQTDEFKQNFNEQVQALSDYISFHGRYDAPSLPALMQETDWVIMPSIWWENAPLVIAEARHHSRPVISSNIGGMAEYVAHEVNGLHFQVGSSNSLADSMQRALQDAGLWNNLVSKTTPPPNNADCAGNYLQLFESL
jgi:glycosyltransferase involved in cell wall biosynthesis